MSEEFKVVYACKSSSGFSFRADKTRFVFEKHQLIVTSKEHEAEIDACLKACPAIAQKVQKVDIAVAEALVANHQKTHGGAHQGPFTSVNGNAADINTIAQRDAMLSAMTPQQEATLRETLAEDSALMTTAMEAAVANQEKVVLSTEVVKPKIQLGK